MIDKLIKKIKETQTPIVVGLDPRLSQVPSFIKEAAFAEKGKTPEAAASAIYAFNQAIIDHIWDIVPAVKPQIAMYEQYGPAGFECYVKTITYAKSKGLVVIGDIKRGDIASTAEAYSDAHLGQTGIDGEMHTICDTDFITVNPYMGYDSIEPYLGDCKKYDRGLFVLVKTSNPSSSQFQDMLAADGRPIYAHVGEKVSQWGEAFIGEYGFSSIGAVVGATHPSQGKELREMLPHTFFLVPGYGAQGGKAADLKGMVNKDGLGIIVNNSRGITGAYQSEKYKAGEKDFAKAARAAALDMKADLEANL
ncbi:MAG: orotidine-5'-phosphate decarboxylase [Defluviitaleaceae bacterium]|nr:orotidine-5'-phosphate decarboxylase [Defluviitaleaceae bacterium]